MRFLSTAITKQAEDISYQVTIKLLEDFATVAQGKEELIELLVYNYLLNIDETAKYSDFVISEGMCKIYRNSLSLHSNIASVYILIRSTARPHYETIPLKVEKKMPRQY